MTVYGIVPTGFTTKPASIIEEEIAADQRASPALGPEWDTSAESPSGQLNGIMAAKLAELWELLAIVYAARVPSNTSYATLDALGALTGTLRRAATYGTVTLAVTLNAATTLPAGNRASVAGQLTNLWETLVSVTNSGGAPAQVTVAAQAVTVGAVIANAATITVIATPSAGWTAVTNAADAVPGLPVESDPALRLRRESELQGAGTSPADALAAHLLDVDDVLQAVVFENDTDYVVDGIPPHAMECMVLGGTDTAVAQAIWTGKAAGIATFGSTSVVVVDAAGASRTMRFSRPTVRPSWIEATVTIDAALYGGTAGDTALKTALAGIGAELLAGSPLLISRCIVVALGVSGVTDASIRVRFDGNSYQTSNLTVSGRERITLDTARVQVIR